MFSRQLYGGGYLVLLLSLQSFLPMFSRQLNGGGYLVLQLSFETSNPTTWRIILFLSSLNHRMRTSVLEGVESGSALPHPIDFPVVVQRRPRSWLRWGTAPRRRTTGGDGVHAGSGVDRRLGRNRGEVVLGGEVQDRRHSINCRRQTRCLMCDAWPSSIHKRRMCYRVSPYLRTVRH